MPNSNRTKFEREYMPYVAVCIEAVAFLIALATILLGAPPQYAVVAMLIAILAELKYEPFKKNPRWTSYNIPPTHSAIIERVGDIEHVHIRPAVSLEAMAPGPVTIPMPDGNTGDPTQHRQGVGSENVRRDT